MAFKIASGQMRVVGGETETHLARADRFIVFRSQQCPDLGWTRLRARHGTRRSAIDLNANPQAVETHARKSTV